MFRKKQRSVYITWTLVVTFLLFLYFFENEWVRASLESYDDRTSPNVPAKPITPPKTLPSVATNKNANLVHDSDLFVSDIPFDEDDERDDKLQQIETMKPKPTTRLVICVVSTNPRTSSVFYFNLFGRIGNGNFDFQIVSSSTQCRNNVNPKAPIIRMLFQKYLSIPEAKKLVARNSLVMVMGDEFCRCSQDMCNNADLIFARQYYSAAYPSSLYIPLGPRSEFPLMKEDESFPFASDRKYRYNCIVSPTSAVRRDLFAKLSELERGKTDVFIHLTPAFQRNASEDAGYIQPGEYRSILLESKFTLCPAGHNPEAFRIFEAIETGSIPVVVIGDEEYTTHDCKDSFASMLDSGAPFVVLETWDELDSVLSKLMEDESELNDRQEQVQAWYSSYWKKVTHDFECKFVQHAPLLDFPTSNYFYPKDCLMMTNFTSKLLPPSSPVQAFKSIPLVTGCGRTGTLSLSEYINSNLGRTSVHEKMEPNAVSVSWLYGVPRARVYPFEGRKVPHYREEQQALADKANLPLFAPVVHVVRHPLKVISSTRRCFCGRGTRKNSLGRISDSYSWKFVETHVAMPKKNLPLESLLRSMTYWYEWNTMIQTRHPVSKTLRIEDLDPNELAEGLGIPVPEGKTLPNRIPMAEQHVSPEDEKIAIPDSTWKELFDEDEPLARKIFGLAKSFGYEPQASTLEDLL